MFCFNLHIVCILKVHSAESRRHQRCQKRQETTEREETILWDMALLGASTVESLLNTVYFYNGKLFGLQAGEHRLIRLSNVVEGNKIVFDEFRGKTYMP